MGGCRNLSIQLKKIIDFCRISNIDITCGKSEITQHAPSARHNNLPKQANPHH